MSELAIHNTVIDCLAELTGCSRERITDSSHLVDDLGVDSMVAVNLVVAIEARIGRQVPEGYEADLASARTVSELTKLFSMALMTGVDAIVVVETVPNEPG